MTTKTEYFCNMCRDQIRAVDEPPGILTRTAGVGVYFVMGDSPEMRPVQQAQNHICVRCLNGLRAFPEVTS